MAQKDQDDHSQVEDHILQRFELKEFKGKGAYGIVWKAQDRKTQKIVALKKVFDAFQNSTDAQRTYREIVYLRQLINHENIIKLSAVIKSENNKDIYMIFEYMETDLHRVIRANILTQLHMQYIIYQLLKCIKYIHSGDLIHRDLKPANILLNSACLVKVADFGLARSVSSKESNNENPFMTDYIATRWYRAPEILLGSHHYQKAVDMWSVGCILGEMIQCRAIFSGKSTINQLEKISELLGKPTAEDLEEIEVKMAGQIYETIPSVKKYTFEQFFPKSSNECIDFLKQKLLIYNPKKRIDVETALDHPYMKDFKGLENEPVLSQQITIPLNENKKLTVKDYREAIYRGNFVKKPTRAVSVNQEIKSRTDDEEGMKIINKYLTESQAKHMNDSNLSQKSKSLHFSQNDEKNNSYESAQVNQFQTPAQQIYYRQNRHLLQKQATQKISNLSELICQPSKQNNLNQRPKTPLLSTSGNTPYKSKSTGIQSRVLNVNRSKSKSKVSQSPEMEQQMIQNNNIIGQMIQKVIPNQYMMNNALIILQKPQKSVLKAKNQTSGSKVHVTNIWNYNYYQRNVTHI